MSARKPSKVLEAAMALAALAHPACAAGTDPADVADDEVDDEDDEQDDERAVSYALGTFPVYDATGFAGKPTVASMTSRGFRGMRLFYQNALWPTGADQSVPDEAQIRLRANEVVDGANTSDLKTVLDIEHWPLGTAAQRSASVPKYVQVLEWFRDERPDLDVGFYATAPRRDYWRAISGDPVKIAQWRAENDEVAPIAEAAAALYPSLYTFYEDRDGWVAYARANIAEAKRLAGGKPVIPFLWMYYHDSTPLEGQLIPADYWQLQLRTVRDAGADGVIVWGGSGSMPWNESAQWLQVTDDFIVDAGLIGHWRADSNVLDTSEQPKTMTSAGGPGFVAGKFGQALRFDGVDDLVKANDATAYDLGTKSFTLASWVYVDDAAGNGAFIDKGVVGACCSADGYPGYFLGKWNGKLALRVESKTAGIDPRLVQVPIAPYVGKWVHVAGVRRGSTLELYVDGQKVGTTTGLPSGFDVDTQYPLTLGGQSYWSTARLLKGAIDDARIYARALSETEIARLAVHTPF